MCDTARPMELSDTAEFMQSADYKDRFKAEYGQVAIRHQKLKDMLVKWDNGQLDFKPTCPRNLYDMQLRAMSDYKTILECRAKMEDIIL